MTNLSKQYRTQLSEHYEIGLTPPADKAISTDGTIKYLFRTSTQKLIESVYIPDQDRATLCVSSQMGCKMNCLFCMTGKQGFNGNLTAGEILNQIQSIPETDKLTNIVFMGMGEPMDNVDELFKVLEILTADWGYAWSPKRITVSSIGLIKNIKRFLEESTCHLAISLHSPFPEERLTIMPVEKAWPMEDLLDLLRTYDFSKQRRLSFEYIMFSGFNDTRRHAQELVHILKGISCRVNLIRFHAIPHVDLHTSNEAQMELFRDYLNEHGITCTIRSSRGEDIFAACGMLSTLKQKSK
jgi:23S rRNA m2A2503 methyltransferase